MSGWQPSDKMVTEAKRSIVFGKNAASLTNVPNIREKGTRLANWLTKEQVRELLAVPDHATVKGKRDYAILALLVGCAPATKRTGVPNRGRHTGGENRWVFADLRGKGDRVRTVAIPLWVKHVINAWKAAGKVEDRPLLRSISKGGKVGKSLSDWAIWAPGDEGCEGERI